MNFGDKFNKAEVDDIFGEFELDDDGFIASKDVIGLFVAGGGEVKKEDAPAPAEEAPAEAPAEKVVMTVAPRRRRRRRRPPSKLCPIIYGSMHLPQADLYKIDLI